MTPPAPSPEEPDLGPPTRPGKPLPRKKDAGRGLSTLALLKVYFNRGKDHIDMLLPFVLDALRVHGETPFEFTELQATVKDRHGLEVPAETLKTILHRAARRGFLRREAGVFVPTPEMAKVSDLVSERTRIEGDHDALGRELCVFAEKRGTRLGTTEEALSLVLQFFEDNHFSLLVTEDAIASAGEETHAIGRHGRLVAGFIRDVVLGSPSLSECLGHMLEGFVLRNALFLRDIAVVGKGFAGLEVFLDSRVVLRLLGYEGKAQAAASRSAIELLRGAGARPMIFEGTIGEVRAILRALEDDIRTPHNLLMKAPTATLRYFLRNHYAPADIRQAASLVEHDAKQLGLPVVAFPPHSAAYTLDEVALATLMLKPGQTTPDRRVQHDVNCIAGVLTLRKGLVDSSIEGTRAVFATTTSLVVRNGTSWYRSQDGKGVSPIVHLGFLVNLAWLKRPAAAATSRMDQLIAACEAALQPSKALWDAFLRELRQLERSRRFSSDECVAIVAHELVEARLADVDLPDDEDAADVAEVIERVRRTIREEADSAIAKSQREHAEAATALRNAHQSAIQEEQGRTREAAETAASMAEESRRLKLRIQARANGFGTFVAWTVAVLLAAPCAAGIVLSLPDVIVRVPQGWKAAAWISLSTYAILTLLGLCVGFSIRGHFAALKSRVSSRALKWLSE